MCDIFVWDGKNESIVLRCGVLMRFYLIVWLHILFGYVFSLVLICWSGIIGYCVLLRDLAGKPLSDWITEDGEEDMSSESSSASVSIDETEEGPSLLQNIIMLSIVVVVTPLTMLRTLTALEKVAMFGVTNVAFLGICIIYKSMECNFSDDFASVRNESFSGFLSDQLWPSSWKEFFTAFPIFCGPFMCHFNVLPVHNELCDASRDRIRYVIRFATMFATFFYIAVGVSGSLYGNCVESGQVEGNILLNFDDDDKLMTFGKAW